MSRNVTGRIAGHALIAPAGEPRRIGGDPKPYTPGACSARPHLRGTFATEADAARMLTLLKVQRQVQQNIGHKAPATESRYFQCPTCTGWHLATDDQPRPRRTYRVTEDGALV